MHVDLDVSGRRVVVVGRAAAISRVVRRYAASGARVTAAVEGPIEPGPLADQVLGDHFDGVRVKPLPNRHDLPRLLRLVVPAWLVVVVGPPSAAAARLQRLAGQLDIAVTTEFPASTAGTVTLVGGGPGSPALLTVAALEALREADVVFCDRLAPRDDLARLAPGAEIVDVGKTPYHHQIAQAGIEDLLIERARLGQSVVRLKGGDPFVFGRGGEELRACAMAGVPTVVVPGVSSAIAVPAAAGIPLTHRGISRAFTVISGHVPPSARELSALVQLGSTIVILMGVANLPHIVNGLRAAGLAADLPAAVVERGYSDSQRTTVTRLDRLAFDARRLGVTSPAVVVIGEVARLGSTLTEALPMHWAS
jgi:uroporphyrin-III C-methyltransferase